MKGQDREQVQKITQGLRTLRPLLSGQMNLQEATQALAAFVSGLIPVDSIALLRLENGKDNTATGFWNADGSGNDFFSRHLQQQLPRLLRAIPCGDGACAPFDPMRGRAPGGVSPLLFPVRGKKGLLGFVVFARGRDSGGWHPEERELLIAVQPLLDVALESAGPMEGQEFSGFVLNTLMDFMSASIYVTDIDSDRILFMNKSMKKAFGIEHPEGQVCWKVLQKGMTGHCSFCPVDVLLRSKSEAPSYVWEEKNSVTGRIYENCDRLVRWLDGSTVHLQQSVDITDARQLSLQANQDELTGMLTRRAGKAALSSALAEAKRDGVTLSVGLYDINALKEINDNFGHAEGDRALAAVAGVVRELLGEKDFGLRMSGDEFVVAFYGKDRKAAAAAMGRAQERLARMRGELGLGYELGFCLGLVQVRPEDGLEPNEVLAMADERMYEQKKGYHIHRREEALRARAPVGEKAFDYDKERLYEALVDATDDYLYVCNMQTDTFCYPKAMVEEFALPGQVIQNAAAVWGAKVHPHDKRAFMESNQVIADGRSDSHCVEYRAQNRRGEWVWLRCRGRAVRDESGRPCLFAGFITNLGKRSKIDPLTGLFNKVEFEDEVRRLLDDSTVSSMGMMVLGIDEFKHINDLYDRVFGDEVLRITAQKIQALLPGNARIYRLDGDEFGIVTVGGDEEELRRIYATIHNTFKHQQEYDGRKYFCTLSAGCSFYPQDAGDYSSLLKYAGYSLEHAKGSGKNRLFFFSGDILQQRERALELIELLRESIENRFEGFELFYQPQVGAASGAVLGAEALARWRCEKYGFVSPAEFIPLLEQSGLILPAGRWIFRSAVEQCAQWVKASPGFVMSINLSYLQVAQPYFFDFMKETLQECGLRPGNVVVELTESCLASEVQTVQGIFEGIRKLGVRIAMDDFGTGYSSLGILKNAPADIVKIDKTFVRDILTSHFDATFIRFVVALCHDVGIEVCLEGVETSEEMQAVACMQLDMVQGYLFGKPQPADKFAEKFLSPRD